MGVGVGACVCGCGCGCRCMRVWVWVHACVHVCACVCVCVLHICVGTNTTSLHRLLPNLMCGLHTQAPLSIISVEYNNYNAAHSTVVMIFITNRV